MEHIPALDKIPDIIQMISLVLSGLTVLATILVRLTPTKADDQMVSSFGKYLVKILQILPTLGVNPQTKKMEETIMELREKTNPGV